MAEKKLLPNVDLLHDLYDFDPAVGTFRWRVQTSSRAVVGAIAGAKRRDGILRLRVGGQEVPASWAAIAMCTGQWPTSRVAHKNNDKNDHRMANLLQGRTMAGKPLTAARLRELLSYDPLTGLFTRIGTASGNGVKGQQPGCTKDGYTVIRIDRRLYRAHRLAWLYVHGEFPTQFIDHINGDRSDNRISNLRDVGRQTNNENRRAASPSSKSGLLGVSPKRDKWVAQISAGNKNHRIGSFDTAEEAHAAYVQRKRAAHDGCTI